MANLWTANHEDGLILPSWGVNAPGPARPPGEGWDVSARPAGGSADMGAYALHWLVDDATLTSTFEGPSTKLTAPCPNEFYGSIQIYPIRASARGAVASSGVTNGFLYGYDLNPNGTRKGTVFEIAMSINPTTGDGFLSVGIGATEPSGDNSVASVAMSANVWSQVDFHVRWNPVLVEIKKNCGEYVVGANAGITLPAIYTPPQEFALFGGGACVEEAWIDNVVINDTVGTFNNNIVCVSGMPGTFFAGSDSPTITPAPEPLPHIITAQDTAGNIPLQRKLQENFESIQRQLMALDPDNQNTSDPQR